MDWANHLNFGLIFFLGFAITAAEEHGLGGVVHHARWKYFFAGLLLTCLRAAGRCDIWPQEVPSWIPNVVDAFLM